MENEKITAIGKLYEKYLTVKRNSHMLNVAVAHDKVTGRNEFVLVIMDEVDDNVRLTPIAKLMTDKIVNEELTPLFDRTALAQVIFNEYEQNDERFTFDEIEDNYLEQDRNYKVMSNAWEHGVKATDMITQALGANDFTDLFDENGKFIIPNEEDDLE
jgi:hypothetical protein